MNKQLTTPHSKMKTKTLNQSNQSQCHRRPLHLSYSLLFTALLLGGCATPGPDHEALKTLDASRLGLKVEKTTEPSSQWWQEFGDDNLNSLVRAALKDRPNLMTAKARLYRAASLAQLSQSTSMPQLGVGLDATRQSYSANGLFGGLLVGTGLQTTTSATLQSGLNWSIDLWGLHAAQTAAALGEVKAQEADLASAALITSAQITQGFISLAKLGSQLEVAERSSAQRAEIFELTRARLKVGLDTNVEVAQAQSAYYEARVQRAVVLEQIELMRHQLAALSAQPMDALDHMSPKLEDIKFTDTPAVIGLDLLGRRPDVVAARWRVEAATKDVQAAKKQFYPNINLNAVAGFNALKSNPLINGNSKEFTVDPAITLPIFDGGRLRAQLGTKRAELDASIAQYNDAVLQAAKESSDVLSSSRSIIQQRLEQSEALKSAKTAYELSLERYKAGIGNYLIVLNTESQWLNQQMRSVDLHARQFETRATLLKVLGGGWQESVTGGLNNALSSATSLKQVAPLIEPSALMQGDSEQLGELEQSNKSVLTKASEKGHEAAQAAYTKDAPSKDTPPKDATRQDGEHTQFGRSNEIVGASAEAPYPSNMLTTQAQ